jgi:hypothetical protein
MRPRLLISVLAAVLVSACATLVPSISGVSPQDVADLTRIMREQKHAGEIYQYHREEDGSILVQADVGVFTARRVRGKWVLTQNVIL